MRSTPLVVTFAFVLVISLACGHAGADGSAPYRTTVDTIGDTLVARTKGDVPEAYLRKLVVEWKAGGSALDTGGFAADISGMTVGPDGRVFVWDHVSPALWLYGADGQSAKRIGGKGAGPGEYDRANGIAARADGKLVMWDGGNARINVYDADGVYVTSWKMPFSGMFTSNGIVADDANRAWIRGSVRNPGEPFEKSAPAWFRWDSAGATVDTVLQVVYTTNEAPLVARRQDAGGTSVSSSGIPYATTASAAVSPLGVVVSGPGRPYVVNSTWQGKALRIERDFVPIRVSDAERAQRRAQMEWNMRRTQENWTWTGRDIPGDKPPYASFAIGLDGRIWVQLYVESEAFEPDPPTGDNKNPPPPIKFRSKDKRWDVYEPDGRYLGRVVAPRQFTAYAMRGNTVWGVLRDDDDVPAVVRMRVELKF